ncbi:unnamed protein product [Vitrella brassicaformis CCMP3155]|uniref:RING-CH-type domain-containing protein n=2 Tax=Vitrella brassicaformis TaxID=1169539 RepID=A0A0G4G3T5_VITBC|nr:unnamed protein product [Vitrella brassicaformis CCMP3155]|eukprot:CEM22827.1 unnamed protein product [Vitrella brassicaformis CCMP3155]
MPALGAGVSVKQWASWSLRRDAPSVVRSLLTLTEENLEAVAEFFQLRRLPMASSAAVPPGHRDGTGASESPTCWICYSNDEEHDLISPCECKGSIGWVHQECLRKWLASRPLSRREFRCSNCGQHYRYTITRKGGQPIPWKHVLFEADREVVWGVIQRVAGCIILALVHFLYVAIKVHLFSSFFWEYVSRGPGPPLTLRMTPDGIFHTIPDLYSLNLPHFWTTAPAEQTTGHERQSDKTVRPHNNRGSPLVSSLLDDDDQAERGYWKGGAGGGGWRKDVAKSGAGGAGDDLPHPSGVTENWSRLYVAFQNIHWFFCVLNLWGFLHFHEILQPSIRDISRRLESPLGGPGSLLGSMVLRIIQINPPVLSKLRLVLVIWMNSTATAQLRSSLSYFVYSIFTSYVDMAAQAVLDMASLSFWLAVTYKEAIRLRYDVHRVSAMLLGDIHILSRTPLPPRRPQLTDSNMLPHPHPHPQAPPPTHQGAAADGVRERRRADNGPSEGVASVSEERHDGVHRPDASPSPPAAVAAAAAAPAAPAPVQAAPVANINRGWRAFRARLLPLGRGRGRGAAPANGNAGGGGGDRAQQG